MLQTWKQYDDHVIFSNTKRSSVKDITIPLVLYNITSSTRCGTAIETIRVYIIYLLDVFTIVNKK